MNSQDVIVARADVKDLYDEILAKNGKDRKKLALLIAKTFLLASDCENLDVLEQSKPA